MELPTEIGKWVETPLGAFVMFLLTIFGIVVSVIGLGRTAKKTTGAKHYIDYAERDRYSEQEYHLTGFGRSIMIRIWGWVRRIRFPIPAGNGVKEIRYVSTKTGQTDSIPRERWQETGRAVEIDKAFMRKHGPERISFVFRRAMSYEELNEKIEISDPTRSQIPRGQRIRYEIENRWDRDVINYKLDLPSRPQEPNRISSVRARHEAGDEISVQSRDIVRIHEIPWDIYEREKQEGSERVGGETRLELQVPRLEPGKTTVEIDYEWASRESTNS